MKHSRKDVTMMSLMGALVLFAAYYFVLKPQGSELSAARGDRQNVEQAISDAALALQRPLDTVAGQPAGGSDALGVAIPADPAMPTLLRQLQAVAVETGVLQGSISPSTLGDNPSGPGGSLQITIAATGSHDAALAYIQRLRDLDRLFVIEQIGISVGADGAEQLQISARVFTLHGPVVAVPITAAPLTTSAP